MKPAINRLALATLTLLAAAAAEAHFKLVEPASWIEEDERGDPQKLGPCGGTIANPGVRTGAITEVQGGQKLKIVVDETIYHPGHYRIALARRPNWLPDDPATTMVQGGRGMQSAAGEIASNPEPPVLVDGLWVHHEDPTEPWQTEIDIPNIDCDGCFLQIIQFMEDHPGFREGGFSYHHCAMLNITPDPALPLDERWQSTGS